MSAIRRVYETPDLMRSILEQCDDSTLLKVITLEKRLMPIVVSVLWREMKYDKIKTIKADRRNIYIPSIRIIDMVIPDAPIQSARDLDEAENRQEKEEDEQKSIVLNLLKEFPNVHKVTRRFNKNDSGSLWNLRRVSPGKYEVEFCVRRAIKPETDLINGQLKLPLSWEGEEVEEEDQVEVKMIPKVMVVLYGEATLFQAAAPPGVGQNQVNPMERNRLLMERYTKYLTSSKKRLREITAVDTGNLLTNFNHLLRLLEYEHVHSASGVVLEDDHAHTLGRVTELRLRGVDAPDCHVDRFERFCQDLATTDCPLKILVIDPSGTWPCAKSFIDLVTLPRAILAIVPTFPLLETLNIAVLVIQHNIFIPVDLITSPPSSVRTGSKMENLRYVTITAIGRSIDVFKDRYAFPLEAVAESLVLLGAGPDCHYELKNSSSAFLGFDVSRQLHNLVHTLQGHTQSIKSAPKRRSLPPIPPELRSYERRSVAPVLPPAYSP